MSTQAVLVAVIGTIVALVGAGVGISGLKAKPTADSLRSGIGLVLFLVGTVAAIVWGYLKLGDSKKDDLIKLVTNKDNFNTYEEGKENATGVAVTQAAAKVAVNDGLTDEEIKALIETLNATAGPERKPTDLSDKFLGKLGTAVAAALKTETKTFGARYTNGKWKLPAPP